MGQTVDTDLLVLLALQVTTTDAAFASTAPNVPAAPLGSAEDCYTTVGHCPYVGAGIF